MEFLGYLLSIIIIKQNLIQIVQLIEDIIGITFCLTVLAIILF